MNHSTVISRFLLSLTLFLSVGLTLPLSTSLAADKVIIDGDKIIIIGEGEQEGKTPGTVKGRAKQNTVSDSKKAQVKKKQTQKQSSQYKKEVRLAKKSRARKRSAKKLKERDEARAKLAENNKKLRQRRGQIF